MPSSFLIGRFIEVENELRGSIVKLLSTNSDIYSNHNFRKAVTECLTKLEIIKNSINEIEDKTLENFISGLLVYSNEVEDTKSFFVSNGVLDAEGEARIVSTITRLLQHINENWNDIFSYDTSNYKKAIDLLNIELGALKKQIETDATVISQTKNSITIELENLREKYKQDLSQYELISQTVNFSNTSIENNKEANIWRIIILIIATLLATVAIYFLCNSWYKYEDLIKSYYSFNDIKISNTIFYYELLKAATLRLFILSLIIYLLKFAVKNYNAAKHNSTVNLHKANSFNAAMRIMTSIPEGETKNSILSNAGKEIFTQQKTGYLYKEAGNMDLSSIEKILSLTKKE
ncbi:MAG: hypothetical protein JST82_05285 [Bacteroidetes bacterium]|nr:hypothetical protein [Bacteroidota bacterium]